VRWDTGKLHKHGRIPWKETVEIIFYKNCIDCVWSLNISSRGSLQNWNKTLQNSKKKSWTFIILYNTWLELQLINFIPPQSPSCPSPWCVGVNSQVGECLVGLCHQGWRLLAEEPPRVLHEVERLTRNPEKLANAGSRCWTLGRMRSFKTHQPPYPTRRGLTGQETKKLLHNDMKKL